MNCKLDRVQLYQAERTIFNDLVSFIDISGMIFFGDPDQFWQHSSCDWLFDISGTFQGTTIKVITRNPHGFGGIFI